MGLRANSIKKFEIEYGSVSGFNYDADTLRHIIEEFVEDAFFGYEGETSYEVIWEFDKEQFSDMISALERMDETEFNNKLEAEWRDSSHSDLLDSYNKDYVLKFLRGCLQETPADSNYVRMGWL